MTDEPTTQRLTIEKETKNTYRYDAAQDGNPPTIDNLYVKKWALGDEAPAEIEVTVEPLDEGTND